MYFQRPRRDPNSSSADERAAAMLPLAKPSDPGRVRLGYGSLTLGAHGRIEGAGDVLPVDVATDHDELANLLLFRLPWADHLLIGAVHHSVERDLVRNATYSEDRLDAHDGTLLRRALRQRAHQPGKRLARHLALALEANGVHARVVAVLRLLAVTVAVPVAVAMVVAAVLVVALRPVAMPVAVPVAMP